MYTTAKGRVCVHCIVQKKESQALCRQNAIPFFKKYPKLKNLFGLYLRFYNMPDGFCAVTDIFKKIA